MRYRTDVPSPIAATTVALLLLIATVSTPLWGDWPQWRGPGRDGVASEVLAWGVFRDEIVSHLGGDAHKHAAVGVGYGLERLAMLRYGIDDIRKIDVASVA